MPRYTIGEDGGGRVAAEQAARGRARVLVVDDHPGMRAIVIDLLSHEPDFEVVATAGNGFAAIDLTAQAPVDVIVLDDSMPLMTGMEALPALRRNCPDARIVVWSATDDVRDRSMDAGADAFVAKAAPLGRLLDELRRGTGDPSA